MKTIIKVLVIAFVYLGLGPLLGMYLNGKDFARRVTLGFMAWWLVRPPSDFTLMLYSIDSYRGHARGFEFNFIEAIGIGLALGALLEKRKDFTFLPPAMWAWGLWVAVCMMSIPNAMNPLYAAMPAFKFAKMAFVFLGVFAAIHDERDVKAVMRGFAIALILQMLVCLWNRYVLGGFRVMGWFEHQNPMSMWSYMLAFPILGLAISKETSMRDVVLCFCAFASAGLVVVLSVSRASLAAFAIGSVIVMLGSFVQGITGRRVTLSIIGALGGMVVMAIAADTFMARMGVDSSPQNDLRWALNEQSAALLRDRPLVGVGWNNFGLANSRPLGVKYSEILEQWERERGRSIYTKNFMRNPLTESLYWLLLAETGLLGFSAFMIFILVTLWHGLRATICFWRTPLGLFFFGMLVALTITYFHGQVERVLTQTKNLTTWIMFCGILSRAEWWRRREKARAKALQNS
ncbi:O-antigen ligase family protein [Luteolibacter yonseiensis]|uniref:O-antigen ligase family protein n=1 Tax=Luteolibacter yonseiensis TaxID=1144680 RepID=UPI0031ED5D98